MNITLVGGGMGGEPTLTAEARAALLGADAILGAPRLLEALPSEFSAQRLPKTRPEAIAEALEQNPGWEAVCVLLSGDAGFYSAAEKLVKLLSAHGPVCLPGLSSVQVLAARLCRPWQHWRLVSAHAGRCPVLAEVLNHPEVFFLTGGGQTAAEICEELCRAGLPEVSVTVGENLGTAAEAIVEGTAQTLRGRSFAPLSVVLAENSRTLPENTPPGLPDSAFRRGKAPMTKREVRANILSLLALRPHDVAYDIGAGSGSVAVEMALAARCGRVYAIESEGEAAALIEQNREAFGVYHMAVLHGRAPEALESLPPPAAAFVGGSRGQLPAILRQLKEKNPEVRVVVSAITLETLHTAQTEMQALGYPGIEVVQIAATRLEQVGGAKLLRAQNPVFLISGGDHHE